MDKLLDAYERQFGEVFPLMLCKGESDGMICIVVQECLACGKPYTPEIDRNADY